MNNEITKTIVFVGIALCCALTGYATLPRTQSASTVPLDQKIFPKFTDPLAAASMEIVKFDEKQGTLDEFKVAKKNGRWVLPSKEDYPADAETQLRDAAIALLDLKILENVSSRKEDYEMYGVVEANEELSPGQKGVGMLVTLKDASGNNLAKLIIGVKAKAEGENSKDATGPQHYFVRRPEQPAIFVTKIDPGPFKTDFSDWIEKDLLKLNGWDVTKLTLKDYSLVAHEDGVGLVQRMNAVVGYDDQQSSWKLDNMTLYGPMGEPFQTNLGDYEELNSQKLNDLKFAIDDLKIVDVAKKPPGLGASLSADEKFTNDREAVMSLQRKGFLPYQGQVYAQNGEVLVSTKEGVEYLLRFGGIDRNPTDPTKVNRYLFVTTRVDEKFLTPPMLEPEPAEPANQPEPANRAADKEGAKPEDDAKAEDNKKDEPKTPELSDTAKAEREKIRKANQRKMDEYNDKVKKAKARSEELNKRFADWYYIVSDETYKKVHLGRSDIVKETSKAKEEGFGVDAFRELEKQGLK